jgi:cytochrome b involved in lipid metabolism
MTKIYEIEEIKKHNKENDCWILINDTVYDITKFINFHPGKNKKYF